MLSTGCPSHLVTLYLHVGDEILAGDGVFQRLVDSLDEIQLPAVAAQPGLVLAGLYALLFLPGIAFLKHQQIMDQTDLVVHLTVCQQVSVALMELVSILVVDAVDDHVVMQMAGVNMGGDYHLKVRELSLGKFQTDGVDLLGRDVVLRGKGLDEVVELRPFCFAEAFLGHLHLNERGLWDAGASGD